jgi:hypothetical protein
MSIRVMARIWDDFPGDGPELLAMLAMGDMANDEGHCWPSMATIAKKIRRSRSQAQRVLHSLIEQGFIVVTDNVNGGAPGTTRRYRIVVERLTGRTDATPGDEPETTEADCKTGRTDATGSADAAPTGSAGATGRTDATGRMDAQDGSHGCDGRGRMDATQTIIETSGTVIPSAPASPAPESRVDCEKSEPGAELFLIDQMGKANRVPPCPTREIVALYRKHLPMLPQPRFELLKGSGTEAAIKERWKWLLTTTRETGERYATNAAEGLDWFDRFFEQVSESDFLTGRNGGWGKADLAWQMKSSNFTKIVQGNYENKDPHINRAAVAA